MAWEFFNGSVADEITMRWNIESYQKIRLKPRVLVDVSKLDTRVNILARNSRSRSFSRRPRITNSRIPMANSPPRAERAPHTRRWW